MNLLRKNLIAALLFQIIISKGISQPSIPDSIRSEVKYRVDSHLSPAIVIGLIDSTGSDFFSYGHLSYDLKKHVDKNTVFEIGSISKVYVSLILANMIEEKYLSLNDPITKYIPDSINVPTIGNESITLEHLSTHSSGLPYEIEPLNYYDYNNQFPKNLYTFLCQIEDSLIVGERFSYSNVGTDLLFQILLNKSGMSYEDLLNKYIIKPYGLYNTYSIHNINKNENVAIGHQGNISIPNWDMTYVLLSSATDLTKFLKSQFIDKKNSSSINTQKIHFKVDNDRYRGLGWGYNAKNNSYTHHGGTNGFRCHVGFNEDKKLGVVVLANSVFAHTDIFNSLLCSTNAMRNYNTIELESSILERYEGDYESLETGFVMNIYKINENLYVDSGYEKYQLLHLGNNHFFIKSEDFLFTFEERDDLIQGYEWELSFGKKRKYKKIK